MRFCKTCGTLYASNLDCCPKCNPKAAEAIERQKDAPKADPQAVKKQWVLIVIGIPLFILAIRFILTLFHNAG